jgi:putative glycosyltransferase
MAPTTDTRGNDSRMDGGGRTLPSGDGRKDGVRLSIVSSMYRSAAFVGEFHERMTRAAASVTDAYEIVLVNDGSPDDSLERAIALAQIDPHVTVVDLSRNFGHHYAVVAGLSQVAGDRVFVIDIDLEEQPEWLPRFIDEQERSQADVVFGVQQARTGGFISRCLGGLFYKLFNAVSEIKIPENVCTVRIATRDFVSALLTLRDRNLFLAGNFAWTGFRQMPISVQKKRRPGPSNYNLSRTLRLFFDAISSFSSYPLRAIFVTGLAISFVSGVVGVQLAVRKLLHPEAIALGFSSIIVSIWFLGGLIIFFLGVIGLYLAKIFVEVKDRPQFIIRRIYRDLAKPAAGPTPRTVIHEEDGQLGSPSRLLQR